MGNYLKIFFKYTVFIMKTKLIEWGRVEVQKAGGHLGQIIKNTHNCKLSTACLPYASSMRAQYGLTPTPFCLDSCSPRRKIFSSPFKAT